MDSPDEQHLKQTIERLTQENAKLRSQLAVAERWNPPPQLEHAFRTARGWRCLTVPLVPEHPTLVLISGAEPGKEADDAAAAGEVWRYLQTAAPPRGRIGPFTRARMPGRLLGYLRDQGGRTVIVLNKDLRRGQVSRAARMLRSNAKMRGPRLLELSAFPLLGLLALHHGTSAKGFLLSAAVAPAATVVLSLSITPSASPYPETRRPNDQTRPTSHVTESDKKTAKPFPESTGKTSGEKPRKRLASSSAPARAPGSAPSASCLPQAIPPERLPQPIPTPSASLPFSPPPAPNEPAGPR